MWMLLKVMAREPMFKGCFRGDWDFRAAAERNTINGNPHVNSAWISFEINLTGKAQANIGAMDDMSQNT
ncbi:hypothetical protein [Paenibacillus radicis (ex Xue et al. 2023)]|uniref:Uncharacterized protein n=1 Tax=Paenibacillus radicis (ex Xue et al. 2023) TaxID=2972489 RepID=A0ABT1YJ95_9BACL|nr:hypothetical protein [Paenibacillus radicis (ex Xue et al. 2023)]MCR8633273.1 hypothetical protein [Paenibacillus radicis (ex Xue et al. 2023)]